MINPLEIKSDPENRHQRIESITLYPRYCDDNSCQIILPHRGYLHSTSRLILPAVNSDKGFQYPPTAGVLALIKTATLKVGDNTVCQMDNANMFYAMRQNLVHLERREKVDAVYKGINSSFETCSGSKRSGNAYEAEVLQGQMRLVGHNGYKKLVGASVKGRKNARPCLMDAQFFEAYTLQSDASTTPEFSVTLGELFPGFFGNMDLPLQLINVDDEVSVELVFSDDGDWGINERCVVCPELLEDKSGVVSVTEIQEGTEFPANATDQIASPTSNGNGTGCRLMYDVSSSGSPYNVRVLDSGSGYQPKEILVVDSPNDGDAFKVSPAWQITEIKSYNLAVTAGGTGYVDGDATLVNPMNDDCSAAVTLTTADGVVQSVNFKSTDGNLERVACHPLEELVVKQGVNENCEVMVNLVYSCDSTEPSAAINAGDVVEIVGDTNKTATVVEVKEINGKNAPTRIVPLSQDAQAFNWTGDVDVRVQNGGATATLNDFDIVALDMNAGLGGSLHSFNAVGDFKVKVVSDKVRMMCDLIYYESGKAEADQKAMMTTGFNKVYTEFRNVQSSVGGNSAASYGDKNETEIIRLIGFSNEILRTLIMAKYPSGTQDNANFENYNLSKLNPLLNKYCSHDSLVEDGLELQVVINSVPRYSSPLNFNPHLYVELAECFGGAFYLPQGAYNGSTSCKQTDNQDMANTQQVGFFQLDTDSNGDPVATSQYELNDRKAGISNQSWGGIDQSYLRGMLTFMGVNFKKTPQNVQGNGAICGSQAVQLEIRYKDTYNPYYSGSSTLCVYGEVERQFLLKQGKVSVTTSSI